MDKNNRAIAYIESKDVKKDIDRKKTASSNNFIERDNNNKKIMKAGKKKNKKSNRRERLDQNSKGNIVDENYNPKNDKNRFKMNPKTSKTKFARKKNEGISHKNKSFFKNDKKQRNLSFNNKEGSKKNNNPYSRARKLKRNGFKSGKTDKYPNIYRGGLWKYSRHPNLFFELVFWFGMAIGGLNDLRFSFFGFVGFGMLFIILRFGTIPITEEYMHNSRPNYEDFCKGTNILLPIIICFCLNRGSPPSSSPPEGENKEV